MRHLWLVFAVSACAPPSPRSPADSERELIQLEHEVAAASERGDAVALQRLMADDFVIAFQREPGSEVQFSNKERSVKHWTTPGTAQNASTTVDTAIAHVTGNVGVVYAHITDRWRDADGDHAQPTAVVDIWVRRGGQWVWFASQESMLHAP